MAAVDFPNRCSSRSDDVPSMRRCSLGRTIAGWFVSAAIFSLIGTFSAFSESTSPPKIQRFIEGIDTGETELKASDAAKQLNDPWGALVLRKGVFPASVDEALAALDKLNKTSGAVSSQSSFFVSESGHIPVDAASASLDRRYRVVISRSNAGNSSVVLMNVPAGEREGLIELMGWDAKKKAFNFYRRPNATTWVWRGDTRDSLRAPSVAKGCFKCHVQGAPIMKELRGPWNNWSSQSASIPREAIPTKEIRDSALFQDKRPAEELEKIVQNWVFRAVSAHIADFAKGKTLTRTPALLRPLFETTTVNLTSSNEISDPSATAPLDVPVRFFINSDVLGTILKVKIPAFSSKISRDHYKAAIANFDFRLEEGSFTRKGDTHFAFFVPEPAFEDFSVIQQLIARKIITLHFALSVLMVDFPNAIYSEPRQRLLRYVPATAALKNGKSDVSELTAAAIIKAAATAPADSPERRFAANFALAPDALRTEAEKQLKDYLDLVQARLATQSGVDDYTRLAQSRRDRFASTFLRELSDFPLMLPKTNIPEAKRYMKPDATIGF